MTVLVLGGTGEARALAERLQSDGTEFVSSLAGRVRDPRLPVGDVRIGGFGGSDGLRKFLRDNAIGAVVDATHPFAAGITANAAMACATAGVPLLRLARPGWAGTAGSATWTWVSGHDEAAATAASGHRVFLSTGRQTLGRFVGPLARHETLVRVVEPLDIEVPDQWTVLHARGPYTVDGERKLMREHDIDTLVTKDSGGDHTRGKLDAAADLGVRVIVVRRPATPAGVDTVDSVDAAAAWARDL